MPKTPATSADLAVLYEHRKFLLAADQKAQEDFDKTVLSLSGGALGISLVFLKDIVGPTPVLWPSLLASAWSCWGLSTLATLVSYHLSHRGLVRKIEDLDASISGAPRDAARPNRAEWLTARLSLAGATAFAVGVILIAVFAFLNFQGKGVQHDQSKAKPNATAASAAGAGASTTTPAASRPRE